ncbi:MAG: heavy-metal-associated domain-containing protein [Bacteroidales bacterium]|nr:heavy-metal-associated domain-containing protein [Bacteroidales bacterium]
MKAFKIFVAVLVATFAFSFNAQAQKEKKGSMEEVTFSVDIHCESCKTKCEANLPYIKGVKDFKVDMESNTIWFKFDGSKVTKQKLSSELAKLGYPGTEVKPENAQKK